MDTGGGSFNKWHIFENWTVRLYFFFISFVRIYFSLHACILLFLVEYVVKTLGGFIFLGGSSHWTDVRLYGVQIYRLYILKCGSEGGGGGGGSSEGKEGGAGYEATALVIWLAVEGGGLILQPAASVDRKYCRSFHVGSWWLSLWDQSE